MADDQLHPAPTSARHLRVRVVENGRQKVDLTLPAAATAHLSDLLPEPVGERLRLRGVDVATIAASAADQGFPPGDLFQLVDGVKQVRVWLE